jgi:hypothetical protein
MRMEYHVRCRQRLLTTLSVQGWRWEYQFVRARLVLFNPWIFEVLLIASSALLSRGTTFVVSTQSILNLRHWFLILNAGWHQYSLTFLSLTQTLIYFLYLLFKHLWACCVIRNDFAIDSAPSLKIVNSKIVLDLLMRLKVAVIIIVGQHRLSPPCYNCLIAQLTIIN